MNASFYLRLIHCLRRLHRLYQHEGLFLAQRRMLSSLVASCLSGSTHPGPSTSKRPSSKIDMSGWRSLNRLYMPFDIGAALKSQQLPLCHVICCRSPSLVDQVRFSSSSAYIVKYSSSASSYCWRFLRSRSPSTGRDVSQYGGVCICAGSVCVHSRSMMAWMFHCSSTRMLLRCKSGKLK